MTLNIHPARCRRSATATIPILFTLTASLMTSAGAASSSWSNPSGGGWSQSTNWLGNVIADGTDQTATIALSSAVTIQQDLAGRTIGFLDFSNADHIIQGNPVTLDVTSGTPGISVAGNTTATLAASLAGSDGVLKSGTGTLVLTAVSSFSGGTTVNAGTLELRGASGGTSLVNGAITVHAGATLSLTNGDGTGFGWSHTISSLTLNGGSVNANAGAHIGFGSSVAVALNQGGSISGNWQWNGDNLLGFSSSGDNTNLISGSLVLRADAGANHTFNVADGAAATDLQVSAVLSDQYPEVWYLPGSALTKSGAGTMALDAINSYDGGTVVNGGTLVVGTNSTLGAGNLTVNPGASCELRNTGGAVANSAAVFLNGTGRLILATGVNETVARLYVDQAALSPGTYTATSHPALINGGGSLIVTEGAPVAPSGLAAGATAGDSIQLTWSNLATDETSYIVERSVTSGSGFTRIATLAAGSVSFVDTGLRADTTYFYRVSAANSIGNSLFSNQASTATTSGAAGIWTSQTSGNWNVSGNWQDGAIANGTGNTATIAPTTGVTLTLGSARTIGGLNFASANHAVAGTGPLVLDVVSGMPVVDVAAGLTATLGVPLAGTEGLSKSGAGNLVIANSPGYGGLTRVDGGRLTFTGDVGTPPAATPTTSYTLAGGNENWPADKRAAIIAAMDTAVAFYNRYGSFNKSLVANYDAGVPTAQAGYGGWIDFGGQIGVRTALHEMGHTMGIGTYWTWNNNRTGDNVWTGANGSAMVKQLLGPSAQIYADWGHFSPYGLNYDDENYPLAFMRHVKVVSAMRQDMGIVSSSELHGYDGLFDIASGAELEFSGSSVQLNGVVSGGGALLHSGTGTLVLAAANTYSGGTTVKGGKVVLFSNSGTSCIQGPLTIQSGATVEATGDGTGLGWQDQISSISLQGGTFTSAGICHIWNIPGGITMTGGTLQSNHGVSHPNAPQLEWNRTAVTTLASAGTATIAGRIRVRGEAGYAGLTFDVADGTAQTDLLVSAAVSEASAGRSLTKSGAGTMMVSGTNSYSGTTTVRAGTLVADATGTFGSGNLIVNTGATCEIRNPSGAIADTAAVALDGTGQLTLATGVVETLRLLVVNGVTQPAGIYTSTSPFITGGGSLIVTQDSLIGNWTSPADGNWSVAGNWQNGTVPDGSDATATFAQATGVTVTLDSNRTLGGLSFANSNSTLTGSPLTLATTFGISNVDVNGAATTATIGSSLAGSSTLTKTGNGTLKLTSVNSHSGGTTVSQGTLELAGASAGTGLLSGVVTVNSGATLALTGGDGTGFGWNHTVSNLIINGGSVNAPNGSHIGFGAYSNVAMSQGATLAGNWQWNGDSLLGFSSSGNSTNFISGSLNLRSDSNANHTFQVADGTADVDLQVNATLTDSYPEVWWLSPSNLIKTGSGTMELAGTNTFDGATTVSQGVLSVSGSMLSTSSVSIAAGAELRASGTLQTSGNVTNSGTLVFSGSAVFSAGGTITNYGTIINSSPSLVLPANIVNHGTIVSLPSAPAGLGATPSGTSAALTWTAVSGASGYRVKQATSASGPFSVVGSPSSNSYTAGALTAGTTYHFVVSAVNPAGEGADSASASCTIGTLPSPWLTLDIGAVGISGSATSANGIFTVNGSGTGVYASSDQFRLMHQTSSGDCQIVARVDSLTAPSVSAKAGVMIRESLAANARCAGIYVTPSSGVQFIWRSTAGSMASIATASGLTAPRWVRMQRVGNSFRAYYSANGISWTQLGGNKTISMTTNAYLGQAVTSGTNAALCSGVFSNITATP